MAPDAMKRLHPDWFTATDYRWLETHRPPPIDMSGWNRMDDANRRKMESWSDNDFTREQ